MSEEKFSCYPSVDHGGASGKRDWSYNNNWRWFLQEKIDGSQFSFRKGTDSKVQFFCGHSMKSEDKHKDLFYKGMMMINSIAELLNPEYTYHTEYLANLKHNSIQYSRLPRFYCIVYDIQDAEKNFFFPEQLQAEANRIGLECVPTLINNAECRDLDLDPIKTALDLVEKIVDGKLVSILGGAPEGVVLKCHKFEKKVKAPQNITDPEQLAKIASYSSKCSNTKLKFVCPDFKERNTSKQPTAIKLSPYEFVQWVGGQFATEARYNKARQRLRDRKGFDQVPEVGTKEFETYEQELLEDLDQDLIKEFKDVIENYLRVELRPWFLNEKGSDSIAELLKTLTSLGQFETEIFNLCIPHVCQAARSSLFSK